jgi:hypothetical protein
MSVELFQKIAQVIPTLHGWCTVERAIDTASTVIATRPKTVVVIGVFGGRDTIAAALACRDFGNGLVIAIDPWSASASVEGQSGEDEKWWNDQFKHDIVYASFVSNVASLGLHGNIQIVRDRSDNFTPPPSIGLLIIDGNHGPQSVRDVERYACHVLVGGFAYLDDLNWSGGSVLDCVEKIKALGFKEIYRRDGGAWFQRISS